MPTSLEQWLDALRQHWRISLLTFLAVMALSVLVILFAPRAYRSDAKLMLRIGRESVALDPTASTVGATLNLHATRENEIKSALGVMESREILERVVDQVGVDAVLSGKPSAEETPEATEHFLSGAISKAKGALADIDPVTPRESALRKLAEGVEIHSTNESSVVSIAYKSSSPEIAQAVVDAWLNSYLEQHTKVNRTAGTYEFFLEQGEILERQLSAARRNLQQAKNEINIVSISGQQLLLEAQLGKVRDGLIEAETEMAALQSRVKAYDQILNTEIAKTITAETTGKANEAHDQMRNQLFALEVLEKDLLSKLTPEHPKLLAVQRQLEDARLIVGQQDDGRKEVTQSVNPAHQQLAGYQLLDKATHQGLVDKREALLNKQKELLMEVTQLNDYEQQIARLQNEVEILEVRYTRHAEQLEQARLEEALSNQQITSVNVVQPASFEQRPVTPRKSFCAVAGFMAACAASFSLPVLLQVRAQQKRRRAGAAGEPVEWPFEQRERALRPSVSDAPEEERSGDQPSKPAEVRPAAVPGYSRTR